MFSPRQFSYFNDQIIVIIIMIMIFIVYEKWDLFSSSSTVTIGIINVRIYYTVILNWLLRERRVSFSFSYIL